MALKHKVRGGVIGFIGYMLSPLSWWNDMFINIPLAVAFAWLVSLIYAPAFKLAVFVGYWLTNIVGLVLLQKGAHEAITNTVHKYSRKELLKDLCFSLLYTLLIFVLVRWKVLQPLPNYFSR